MLPVLLWPVVARADMPWPGPTGQADKYAYQDYLHASPAIDCRAAITNAPSDLDCNDWHMTSKTDPLTPPTAQELGGVMGPSVDKAWDVTTGRPDIHVAVLDSGIMWDDGSAMNDLRRKIALNWAELPPPERADGTSTCDGVTLPSRKTRLDSPGFPRCYDLNGDGVFNIDDYAQDPRVNPPNHQLFCHQCYHGLDLLTPEDLIQVFSCFNAALPKAQQVGVFLHPGDPVAPRQCSNGAESVDNDGNGFPHDIAGWNFMEHTNDPFDEPHYGHGTGEARDSNAEANNGGDIGTCPSCMVLPLKVGDSFIADVNDFAQAVMYATDNGVSVVQEALGTLNRSGLTQAAIDYSYRHGVTIIASAADESAGHHNQPGSTENHTVVVNSVRKSEANDQVYGAVSTVRQRAGLPPLVPPQVGNSYLLLNGCTNYGAHTIVAVESASCSSEATGKTAGVAGLMYAEACNLAIKSGVTRTCRRGVDISPNEVKQALAAGADDINFEDASSSSARGDSPADSTSGCGPQTDPPGVPNNYGGTNAGEHFHSIAGWDQYFGYGRESANCSVRTVLTGRIPPEASIDSPAWFANLDTTVQQSFPVTGHVAAPRSPAYSYKMQIAYGVQPHEDDWTDLPVAQPGTRTRPLDGVLATLTKSQIDAAFAAYNPATYLTGRPGHPVHYVNPNGDQTDWLAPPYTRAGNAGKNQWDEFTFTLRVQVTARDGSGNAVQGLRPGEDRKTLQSHHDDGVGGSGGSVAGFPKQFDTDGASDPTMADLLGDNQNYLVFGTSSGLIHALRADGTELPGWPVHTTPLCDSALPDAAVCPSRAREPAFSDSILGPVAQHSYAAVLRGVAVGDLDRSGHLEVVASDAAGYIYAFDPSRAYCASIGQPAPCVRKGFPVHVNFDYSRQGLPGQFNRDHDNRLQFGFFASPTLADLNNDGRLEIIDGALDRHVYAFRADGSAQPGFPVLLASPEKVLSIDSQTHRVHLKPDAGAFYGTKIVSSPSVGDLLGDGRKEIVVGRNEEYDISSDGGYNASADSVDYSAILPALGGLLKQANGRVYAVFSDGYCHGLQTCPATPPDAVPANAYVSGWPAKVGIFNKEVLPTVGSGVDTAPALISFTCPVNNQPGLKVGVSSNNGPSYVFQSDGKSCFGQSNGTDGNTHDRALGGTLQPGAPGSDSQDFVAASAFGMNVFGDLNGKGDISLITPTIGLIKAVDVILADHQLNAQNHITAWSLTQPKPGCQGATCVPPFHNGFPHYMNDLQFLAGPAIADITGAGDGRQQILMGSASSDFRAVQPDGTDLPGWSKNTGDWTVATPAVGTVGTVPRQRVASLTRDGRLFLWETTAPACSPASWPKARHDIWNSGEYETKAGRPATILDLGGRRSGGSATLAFTAPHGDLMCGDPTGYEVRYSTTGPITDGNWSRATLSHGAQLSSVAPAGQQQQIIVSGLPSSGRLWVEVQATNDASRVGHNLGAISNNLSFGGGSGGTEGGSAITPHPVALHAASGGQAVALLLLIVAGLVVALALTRGRRSV